jgi:hypothetical protein
MDKSTVGTLTKPDTGINSLEEVFEDRVRDKAQRDGYRLMRRRSYAEKGGNKYWLIVDKPMTLPQIYTLLSLNGKEGYR